MKEMIWQDWLQFVMIIAILAWALWRSHQIRKKEKEVDERWEKFINDRKELYKRLADPECIAEQMERGASLREMRDANRTTLPREDAGPPAVVHRPPLRGVKPGTWRPRNPGSPSSQ
ncbi:hypothetical protein CL65_gp079 [Mycobacterium phage Patience]|uniref:Uncharacterized protein n=2 Tax=Patiencevirus patience TaxID=1982360 RepID=A0A0K1LS12_9CAUD|nr:hypothetical protein CL65_gp079 [Mycobacterium phage Patience]AEL97987.1 hypothetical protein PATIENCE_78 [Mycobacterium phage Patience]AKU45366.1 hypothetical protein MADRUGA_76 [Mycobacterium phage Madruga]